MTTPPAAASAITKPSGGPFFGASREMEIFLLTWPMPEKVRPWRVASSALPGKPPFVFRMRWDNEPTPSPSQEGSGISWPVPLLGGVRGGFICARFLVSFLSLLRMHREHEPRLCLTLTRNLTLTLHSSIKIKSMSKSRKCSAESAGGAILTPQVYGELARRGAELQVAFSPLSDRATP